MAAERIPTRRYVPKTAPSAPTGGPPPEPDIFYDDNPPRLWHFTHSHPELPATLSVTVNARTEADARGCAYLLAEDFCQRIIGRIQADS